MRFSLRTLILFVSLLAVALTIWRVFFYFPEAHRNRLYEYADSTRQLAAQIGPNVVSIKLVSRNDRDGSIHVEDGKGQLVSGTTPHQEQVLKDCSDWLDVVQIELDPGPDLLDINEIRVFDHETHEILTINSESIGWRRSPPNVIQIYGLGRKIPEKIDLWMRMHSYDPETAIMHLDPLIGAKCDINGGTISVADLRKGRWSWHSAEGLREPSMDYETSFTALFKWEGPRNRQRYHIKAVDERGQNIIYDFPNYIHFENVNPPQSHENFGGNLSEVNHFEVRKFRQWPIDTRSKFYFSDLKLPKTSNVGFAKPPVAKVQVGGEEVEQQLAEFSPLEMTVAAHRGDWAGGTMSNGRHTLVTRREGGAVDLDTSCTVVYAMLGMGYVDTDLKLLNKKGEDLLTVRRVGRIGRSSSHNSTSQAGYNKPSIPLEEIDAVEIRITPK